MHASNALPILVLLATVVPLPSLGNEITLTPDADASLISAAPNNNNGGENWVLAGVTQNYTTNRGLFRFDIASVIPPGALIQSADLLLEVTRQPRDGYAPASFGLHRVLQPWGEGDNYAVDNQGGLGAPAGADEVTWNTRFAPAHLWAVPGGMGDIDYAPMASSQAFIYGVGDSPYTFLSTPTLIADVQTWLDAPASNFGWMLICQEETQNFTARRFGAREDPVAAPRLLIEFTVVPEPSSVMLGLLGLAAFAWVRWTSQTRRCGAGRRIGQGPE